MSAHANNTWWNAYIGPNRKRCSTVYDTHFFALMIYIRNVMPTKKYKRFERHEEILLLIVVQTVYAHTLRVRPLVSVFKVMTLELISPSSEVIVLKTGTSGGPKQNFPRYDIVNLGARRLF